MLKMRALVMALSVLLAACAQDRPRCDEHLRPINPVISAPAAKSAPAELSP
jgi:hypothetical protein